MDVSVTIYNQCRLSELVLGSVVFAQTGRLICFFFTFVFETYLGIWNFSTTLLQRWRFPNIISTENIIFSWRVFRSTFDLLMYFYFSSESPFLNQQFKVHWNVCCILEKNSFLASSYIFLLIHSVWVKYLEPCVIYLEQFVSFYCHLYQPIDLSFTS